MIYFNYLQQGNSIISIISPNVKGRENYSAISLPRMKNVVSEIKADYEIIIFSI